MDAKTKSISDIFNGGRILEIPFFQRAYVWEEQQWERFLNDMEHISATNKPYFLGSIILKQQGSSEDVRTIVDGQQRITTLSIFFKVLSLKKQEKYLSELFRLRKNSDIALRHNHSDVESFNRIQDLQSESDFIPSAKNKKDRILDAFQYFSAKIDPALLEPETLLNNIQFVGIDLFANLNEDEQQIFDTINSLGVRLTTAELLKNYFFSKDDIKEYQDNWRSVFESEDNKDFWDAQIQTGRISRSFSDIFFGAFLQIKSQAGDLNVSAEDKKAYARYEGLFSSYKEFVEKYCGGDKRKTVEEIKEYAELFQKYITPEVCKSELSDSNRIERLNAIIFRLENTTLIPYVLFVLKNVKDEAEQNRIFDYLESYIMRRMVCRSNNKNYNQLFGDRLILNGILTKDDLKNYIEKNDDDSINGMPSDEMLRESFHESVLINKHAAGVLYFLETKIRNKDFHGTSLLGIESYSLEHVMPKKWENNWPHPATEADVRKRHGKLLTLGNLTIITSALNSSIRDGSWTIKRDGNPSKKQPGLKQYASGLETFNSRHLALPEWNEQSIADRADYLFENAVAIWPGQ